MPLETDLSQAPYHDDYDPNKDFHRVLFKPSVSVQVREINQLQTILQTQIERFGDNILRSGTILEGCNFQFVSPYSYAKLLDNETNGTLAVPANYVGYFAKNSSNLQAVIINSEDGFESTDPDLKTIYLHYRNAGLDGNTFGFVGGDTLTIFDPEESLFGIDVENGGVGFSNSDTVIVSPQLAVNVSTGTFSNGEYITNPLTGANLQIVEIDDTTLALDGQVILKVQPRNVDLANASVNSAAWTIAIGDDIRNIANTVVGTVEHAYGHDANAAITTDGAGRISSITMNDGGEGYSQVPVARVRSANNSTGLSSLDLVALNFLATIRVANVAAATGNAYAFGVTDGFIYQKGHFLRVANQVIIVDKYSQLPNNVSVGFQTLEEIIDSNEDTSLLDNATGTENEFAPGADRLRLTPTLVTIATDEITTNSAFFPIVSFSEGNAFRLQQATAYSKINDEMARRTSEAHGNFSLNKFQVTTRSTFTANNEGNLVSVVVDPGTAYLNGYRVQTVRNFVLDIPKGYDTLVGNLSTVSLQYRNYIRVKNIGGVFQFNTGDQVTFYDTAKNFLGNVSLATSANTDAVGNAIGTARVRSMSYESGTPGTANAAYRLFLFDLSLNQGRNFSQIRSVRYNGTYKGIADIITELDPTTAANVAILHYPSEDTLLFPAGVEVVQSTANTVYTYRTIDQTLAMSNAGIVTKSLAAVPNEFFPYSGNLSDNEMQELYVIPLGGNLRASANMAGTATINTTSTSLIGSGTTFIADLVAGDYVYLTANATANVVKQVVSITNNTLVTLDSNGSFANTVAIYRYFPKLVPIPFGTREGLEAAVDANGNVLTANLNIALDGSTTINVALGVNIERQNVPAGTKTAARDQFVKLCMANVTGNTVGPWCLGIPDILRLKAVYLGSNSTVANTDTNVLSDFYIDHNQNQNYLNLGYLFKTSHSGLTLNSASWLLVQYDALTVANTGFFDTTSYVSSNITQVQQNDSLPLANLGSAINSWEIPEVYTAQGRYYDLLNTFDFRPRAANTANLTTNSATATVNPSAVVSFGNTADPANDFKFPVPESSMVTRITQYLGRIDSVFVGQDGNIFSVKGTPAPYMSKRSTPNQPQGSMKLNDVYLPAYPNLPVNPSNNVLDIISTRMANERYSVDRHEVHRITTTQSAGDIENNQPSVYTMKDIGAIDRRLRNVEYYQQLTLLETDVVNRVVPSSVDPTLNRFKFGFYADDFSTSISQDTTNPQYSADVVEDCLVPNSVIWTVTNHSNGVYSTNYLPWPIVKQPEATANVVNSVVCVCVATVTTINLVHWHFHRCRHRRDDECGHRYHNDDDFRETFEIEYGVGNCAIYFATDVGAVRFRVYRGGTLILSSGSAVSLSGTHVMDKVALADSWFTGWSYGSRALITSYGEDYCSGHGKLVLPAGLLGVTKLTIVVSKGRHCRKWRWIKVSYPPTNIVCVCGVPPIKLPCRYIGIWTFRIVFRRRCVRPDRRQINVDGQLTPIGRLTPDQIARPDIYRRLVRIGWIDWNCDQEFIIIIRGLRPNCKHNFFCHGYNKNHRCKYRGRIGGDLIVDAYGVIEFSFLYNASVDQDITAILLNSTTPVIMQGTSFNPVVSRLNVSLTAPESEGSGVIDLNTSNFTVEDVVVAE